MFEDAGLDQSTNLDEAGGNIKESLNDIIEYVRSKTNSFYEAAQRSQQEQDVEMEGKDRGYRYGQEEHISEE